jgi:hypothetical protein
MRQTINKPVPQAMQDRDDPKIAGPVKQDSEEYADREYPSKDPKMGQIRPCQREVIRVEWAKSEYQVAHQDARESSPATDEFGLE